MNPCACRCGLDAGLARYTDRRRGTVKGEPLRFRPGHSSRVYRPGGWNGHRPDWFRNQDERRRA